MFAINPDMYAPLLLILMFLPQPLWAHDNTVSKPQPERSQHEQPWEKIDRIVSETQAKHNVKPGPLADTDEFVRRAFLDLIGRPPTKDEAARFGGKELNDVQHEVCDYVLDNPDYGMYWSTYWKHAFLFSSREDESVFEASGDTFKYKKLSTDLVNDFNQKAHRFDQTLWKLLTALDNGGLPGWYIGDTKKTDEKSEERTADFHPLTDKIGRTFLGVRIGCVQCHDDVLDSQFSQKDYWELNAFFRNYRVDGENPGKVDLKFSEKLRLLDFESKHDEKVSASILGKQSSDPQLSPLEQLAETLPNHELFSKAIVNRYWHQLFGFSLNWPRQYDNMLIADKEAPFNSLWDALAADFKAQKHKPRELLRWICKSKTYARTSKNSKPDFDYFSHMPAKPVTEEQLAMTMASLSAKYNPYENYKINEDLMARFDSVIREDGLYRVGERRLEARLSPQHVLNMMNSPDVESIFLKPTATRIVKDAGNLGDGKDHSEQIAERVFRTFLNRSPIPAEKAALATFLGDAPSKEQLENKEKKLLAQGFLSLYLRMLGRSTSFNDGGVQISVSFPGKFQGYQLEALDKPFNLSPDDEQNPQNLFFEKVIQQVKDKDWSKVDWDEIPNHVLGEISSSQKLDSGFLWESGLKEKISEFKNRATLDYWLTHELTWLMSNSGEFLYVP